MFANIILALFSMGTIVLYAKVRKHSKKIGSIEETTIEPDKRVDEHEKKIISLEETQEKSNKGILNLTKKISTLEKKMARIKER